MASRFSTLDLIVSVLVLLTPVGVAAALSLINLRGRERVRPAHLPFCTSLHPFPPAVFTYFSFRHRVELNWTAPVLLALLPPLALPGTAPGWGATGRTLSRGFLLYAVTLYHLAVGWPGLPYPRLVKPASRSGGAELGLESGDALEDRLETETGSEPTVVGMGTLPAPQ